MTDLVWLVRLKFAHAGVAATLEAAKRIVDDPFRPGLATALNNSTGEDWERSKGKWSLLQKSWPTKGQLG